jgi:hypothetical protein
LPALSTAQQFEPLVQETPVIGISSVGFGWKGVQWLVLLRHANAYPALSPAIQNEVEGQEMAWREFPESGVYSTQVPDSSSNAFPALSTAPQNDVVAQDIAVKVFPVSIEVPEDQLPLE